MSWKIYDYQCSNQACRHTEEALVENEDESRTCPSCESDMHRVYSSPLPVTIVKGNADFNERQRERLEKRSAEHYKKVGVHEAIARTEAQRKQGY
jgi:putative FmdB family regulatory protein